jgi:hypothetical protein
MAAYDDAAIPKSINRMGSAVLPAAIALVIAIHLHSLGHPVFEAVFPPAALALLSHAVPARAAESWPEIAAWLGDTALLAVLGALAIAAGIVWPALIVGITALAGWLALAPAAPQRG